MPPRTEFITVPGNLFPELSVISKMNEEFYLQLYQRQRAIAAVPANTEIAGWAMELLNLLFPERLAFAAGGPDEIKESFTRSAGALRRLLRATKACACCNPDQITADFCSSLPELYRQMNTDVNAALSGDPAAKSEFEIIRSYPGFLALSVYRIAHQLLQLGVPVLPRILTEYAHTITGIDIHPGAVIGEHIFIDHGTGIVIGETAVIGSHVKIYQGVTLGALSVSRDMAGQRRHPVISDHVIIYSGATILGGDTVIGEGCIIGGNVWLTRSVPAGSTVYHQSAIRVITQTEK